MSQINFIIAIKKLEAVIFRYFILNKLKLCRPKRKIQIDEFLFNKQKYQNGGCKKPI